jgi:chemotaxis protein histidine kinase CheA
MAFHLKNLKTQKDKFFLSMTAQQLCDMLSDGEIMSYINKIPIRRDELGNLISQMGDPCNMRKTMAPGVRQKKLAPIAVQLSKIIKEYETKKAQMAANLANQQRRQKEAANAAAAAQAEANRKAAENRQREANARAAEEAAAAAKAAANAQMKAAEQAAAMAVANVAPAVTVAENSALTKELMNLKKNFSSLNARLNKAIQNSRNTTRTASAARRGGRRRGMTRKSKH